jgi:hypothetical protein
MRRSLFDRPAELDDRVARVITNTRAAGRQHLRHTSPMYSEDMGLALAHVGF